MKTLLATLAIVSIVIFAGCKKDDYVETKGVCPIVISTVPTNGATGVPINQIITVTFNERMNPATITQTSFTLQGGSRVSGTLTYDGSGPTFSFTPSVPLLYNTTYTGRVATSVKDNAGNALQKEYVWTFTTIAQYTVVLSANPLAGGTTTGGGTFDNGATVTIGATANSGYTFTNWTEGVNVVSTNANYLFTVTGNATLVANFTENVSVYTVTVAANPLIGGTVTGGGSFNAGTSITVGATANAGYTFINWTEGVNVVSTNANYLFTVTGNTTLVANFSENVSVYTVTVAANPPAGGTTTGGGSYNSGASVTVGATANVGYTFTNWTEGVLIVSTDANYNFTITGNRILTANFNKGAVGPGAVNLGSAADFEILTKSGISTTGVTSITGDIGVSPAAAASITGFGLIMDANNQSSHTPIVIGKVYAADYAAPTPAKMTTAVSDMETAYTTANGLTVPAPVVELGAGNISGMNLAPGLYKWSTGLLITGSGVTLTGSADDTWVFQIAQNLTVDNSVIITLAGGAQAKNIFWVVAGQATLGTMVNFSGNILSKTLISLNDGAIITGRLLAQTAVTLIGSTVIKP